MTLPHTFALDSPRGNLPAPHPALPKPALASSSRNRLGAGLLAQHHLTVGCRGLLLVLLRRARSRTPHLRWTPTPKHCPKTFPVTCLCWHLLMPHLLARSSRVQTAQRTTLETSDMQHVPNISLEEGRLLLDGRPIGACVSRDPKQECTTRKTAQPTSRLLEPRDRQSTIRSAASAGSGGP